MVFIFKKINKYEEYSFHFVIISRRLFISVFLYFQWLIIVLEVPAEITARAIMRWQTTTARALPGILGEAARVSETDSH